MKDSSLKRTARLLEALRAHPALYEVRPTHFLLDGKEFLHFHDQADGIVADVRLAKGRVSMPVASDTEQGELMDRIDRSLASLVSRTRDRKRRRRPI